MYNSLTILRTHYHKNKNIKEMKKVKTKFQCIHFIERILYVDGVVLFHHQKKVLQKMEYKKIHFGY
jgi:hypothetical protein